MVIQFTLQGLMIFLACALGIAAGIILLPILWNIKKLVDILRSLLEINQEYIKKTIKTMPGIFENVGQISNNVRAATDEIKISAPVILKEVECTANAAKGIIELAGAYNKDTTGFMPYLHIFEEVLQIIYRTLSSSK
jgi:predicted PurR-regulated permease PerM